MVCIISPVSKSDESIVSCNFVLYLLRLKNLVVYIIMAPIPVAAQSKAWVCGSSLAGIVGSNPTGGYGCLSVVSVVCCQVEVSASGWSFVQRIPTECAVSSECNR